MVNACVHNNKNVAIIGNCMLTACALNREHILVMRDRVISIACSTYPEGKPRAKERAHT